MTATENKMFESSVNLQGSKTADMLIEQADKFESSVNLQGSKTPFLSIMRTRGLRVV